MPGVGIRDTQLGYTHASWTHLQNKKDWTSVLLELVLMSLAKNNAAVLPSMQRIHVSKDIFPTGNSHCLFYLISP